VKIPVTEQIVKYSDRPVWQQQPCHKNTKCTYKGDDYDNVDVFPIETGTYVEEHFKELRPIHSKNKNYKHN